MINEEDLELKLLAGLSIPIENIVLQPLKIKNVIDIGVSEYYSLLSHLLIDIKNANEEIKETFREHFQKEITAFDLFTLQNYNNEEFKKNTLHILGILFNEKISITSNGIFYFGELKENKIITEEVFSEMQTIVRKANLIKDEKKEVYNPANERAKKFIEKLKKNKEKLPKKKEPINLHSIISGVAWKGNTSIHEVLDLTIYQLYDAFHRLENIDNYHYTLTGMYSGTIDGKKINVKNINWAKTLQLF